MNLLLLLRHLKYHLNLTNIKCGFRNSCPLRFSTLESLVRHSHFHSKKSTSLPPVIPSTYQLEVQCLFPQCGLRKFNTVDLFLKHFNGDHHTELRQCPFNDCYKVFKPNDRSRNHILRKHKQKTELRLRDEFVISECPSFRDDRVRSEAEEEITDNQDISADGDGGDHYDDDEEEGDHDAEIDVANEDLTLNTGKQLKMEYSNFLNKLHTSKYVPASTIDTIATEYCKLEELSNDRRKENLREKLKSWFPDQGEDFIEYKVEEVFGGESILTATTELKTSYNRKVFMKENFPLISPEEVVLNRSEVRKGGRKDCYQYVPIVETLDKLCCDKSFQTIAKKEIDERDVFASDGFYQDVKDGLVYKSCSFFKDNPDAKTIMLYSDGLQVVNPLSYAKSSYKLVPVYMVLAETPRRARSKIKQILLVQVFEEHLLKKYPLKIIFARLIKDLKRLEYGVFISGRCLKARFCYFVPELFYL